MNNYKSLTKKQEITLATIILVLYVFSYVLMSICSNIPIIHITNTVSILGPSVSGVIGCWMILLLLLLVLRCDRYGFKLCILCYTIDIVIITFAMISRKSIVPIPGLFMFFVGLISTFLVHNFKITISKKETILQQMAYTDFLTSIKNRRSFIAELQEVIAQKKHFALIIADINNFKHINDSLGHASGDIFLTELTARWTKIQADNESIFRLSGDEFAFIFYNETKPDIIESQLQKYIKATDKEFVIDNILYNMKASYGISIYPTNAKKENQLFKYADMMIATIATAFA